jgi:hypothetical protein
VDAIVDPEREVSIVVLTPSPREQPYETTRRGVALSKSLAGIAPVFLLGPGAVTAFSKATLDQLGDRMDVYAGAIRTYAPRAGGEFDNPFRHRLVVYGRIERRPPVAAVWMVAAPLLARAAETPPPAVWRDRIRPLLERTVGNDSELLDLFEEESAQLEADLAELRSAHDALDERYSEAESDNIALLAELDRLQARVRYLRAELAERDVPAAYAEPADDSFKPEFCSEVVAEAQKRLDGVVFDDSVMAEAEMLDAHAEESWARKAWSAFQALNDYVLAKKNGFAGDFLAYNDQPTDGAKIPKSWIGRHESQTTKRNARFRDLRTLPISRDVDASGKVLMEEHVKIAQGGTPAPRIHFYERHDGCHEEDPRWVVRGSLGHPRQIVNELVLPTTPGHQPTPRKPGFASRRRNSSSPR